MKWRLHQYLYKIFPKLLNLTSTALVLAKKPDKADDEEKQEEDKIKSSSSSYSRQTKWRVGWFALGGGDDEDEVLFERPPDHVW